MVTATKVCRICGKEYEACHSAPSVAGAFRWQEVACSPECGAEYLRQIKISRGELEAEPVEVKEKKVSKAKSKKAAKQTEEPVTE